MLKDKDAQGSTEEAAQEEQQTPDTSTESTDTTEEDKGTQEYTGEDTTDKHGLPGINRDKYERDIKERDDKIAELEAQIAEASKSDETAKELKEKIEALKAESADKDLTYELAMAGCVDAKAAKARLEDFEGDVNKLKAACPYLFAEEKKTGSTGRKPVGASTAVDDLLDRGFKKK